MGKIVDTQLNVFGEIIDGNIISISNQDIVKVFDNQGPELSSSHITNSNEDVDIPTGSYDVGYCLTDNDPVASISGVIQLIKGDPLFPVMFSTYAGTPTQSLVSVFPEGVSITAEAIQVNGQLTYNGDVNISGTTFSIVNGLIVDVIQ